MSPHNKLPTVFMIAGEPSGDDLGGALLQAMQQLAPNQFLVEGVGGTHMSAAGLKSLFNMQDLSVMGVVEVLRHLPRIYTRYRQTCRAIQALRPDVLVTIDAPDFSLRVQKWVAKNMPYVRRVHYVAPTVWAWRPKRAYAVSRFLDSLLCLFPMEPNYFRQHGLEAHFVGHPLAGTWPQVQQADVDHFWQKHHLSFEARPVVVLFGSRKTELKHLGPRFKATMQALAKAYPNLVFLVPTLPHLYKPLNALLEELIDQNRVRLMLDPADKIVSFRVAEVALHASGTVALELALSGTPMVTAYHVSSFTAWLFRRMVTSPYVNLVNILLPQPIVPELLQENCTPPQLWQAITHILDNPDAAAAQRYGLQRVRQLLLPSGAATPAYAAAQVVLAQI